MNYERPKLVMLLGSSGGYKAFRDVMDHVDYEAVKNSEGSIYLVEHLWPNPRDLFLSRKSGIKLFRSKVRDGKKLESGKLYIYPNAYEDFSWFRRTYTINPNGNGGELQFMRTCPPGKYLAFTHSIKSAIEAGYGEDMMVAFLSGLGLDGFSGLDAIKENGSKLVFQHPASARCPYIIKELSMRACEIGLDYGALYPHGLGTRINEFLES